MEQMRFLLDKIRQNAIDFMNALKDLKESFKGLEERLDKINPALNKILEVFKNVSVIGLWIKYTKKVIELFEKKTEAAKRYTEQIDILNDAETNYMNIRAENLRQIAELEARAQDRTLSAKARQQALKQAIAISEQELKKTKEFADNRFNLELKLTAAKYGLKQKEIKDFIAMDDEQAGHVILTNKKMADFRNKIGDEGYKNLEELYSKSIEADTRVFNEQKRNISRL